MNTTEPTPLKGPWTIRSYRDNKYAVWSETEKVALEVLEINNRAEVNRRIADRLKRYLEQEQNYASLERQLAASQKEKEDWKQVAGQMAEALKAEKDLHENCTIEDGVCCCGEDMDKHTSDHGALDHGAYIANKSYTKLCDALSAYNKLMEEGKK